MKAFLLMGFYNMFNIVPDFVYPVFKSGNELYLQTGEKDRLQDFVPLKQSAYDSVIPLSTINVSGLQKKTILTNYSRPLYGFQTMGKEIVAGNSSEMLAFFAEYEVNNDILKEEIQDFCKEVINKVRVIKTVHVTDSGLRIKYAGIGRKGQAIARVYLVPGNGNFTVNGKAFETHFGLDTWKRKVLQPLIVTNTDSEYDVIAYVHGARLNDQAGAIKIGIMKALARCRARLGAVRKVRGCTTTVALKKEQKGYGLKAGRKAPQLLKK